MAAPYADPGVTEMCQFYHIPASPVFYPRCSNLQVFSGNLPAEYCVMATHRLKLQRGCS